MSAIPANGFWDRKDPYKALCKVALPPDGGGSRMDAGIFLHGVCGIFALTLAEEYGYPIYVTYAQPESEFSDDEDEPDLDWCVSNAIHFYCVEPVGDDTWYIDVRGRTKDWDQFMGVEFDGLPVGGWFEYPATDCRDFLSSLMTGEELSYFENAAKEFLRVPGNCWAPRADKA